MAPPSKNEAPHPDAPGAGLSSLEKDIAAWLATVAAEKSETIRDDPASTIAPTVSAESRQADTAGQRAVDLLRQLADGSMSAQLAPGKTLGEGGMGVVRLAEQQSLGRTVAVKTLRADRHSDAATLDLLREAWVTGSLEHPNIVPVYALGFDRDQNPQIVLKRIEGVHWGELINDATAVEERFDHDDLLSWNLSIFMHVLNALRFAHTRSILHRDVKPANVMIGEFGEVYLLDWGIAVSLKDDGSGRLPLAANTTEMAGTPCYMAPEMLGPDRGLPLSERTDVYLAGAVLCEILAGEPPHTGETVLEIVTSVALSEPTLPEHAPLELVRICRKAMHANPSQRFAGIEELRKALHAYIQHRGSDQLAVKARTDLEELHATVAATHLDEEAKHEQIVRLYGACQFGFREALSAWPENPSARSGLRETVVAAAEHELSTDDPRAALNLLAQLEQDAPAELLARARSAARAQEQRKNALDTLEQQHDGTIGIRTRAFISLVLGLVFTAAPLVRQLTVGTGYEIGFYDARGGVVYSLVLLACVLCLGYWARESMTKTVLNRRVFSTVVVLFVTQAIMFTGMGILGAPLLLAHLVMMLLWLAVAGMFTVAVDYRFAPCTVVYAAAFLAAARFTDQRYYLMAAANLALTVNILWAWRPANIRFTAEERRARGARGRP